MSLRINQNITAMNAYRNLSVTSSQMSKSLEKLSSGYRINRAADDAAGLAISEGLRSQIGGLKVAGRNTQDAINVVQTADGALNETTSILQRMRDLSVQAANDGGLDAGAKQNIQTEMDQLKSELTRISDTTQFNGTKLLDGNYNGSFQVGANAGETISGNVTPAMSAQGLGLQNVDVTGATALSGVTSTSAAGTDSVAAVTGTDSTATLTFAGGDADVRSWVSGLANKATDFKVDSTAVDLSTFNTSTGTIADLKAAIDTAVGTTNYDTTVSGNAVTITSHAKDGQDIALTGTTGVSVTETAGTAAVSASAGTASQLTGTFDFSSLSGVISLGEKSVDLDAVLGNLDPNATDAEKATALQNAFRETFAPDASVGSDGTFTINAPVVGTQEFAVVGHDGADTAITKLDKALDTVSTVRANLGAYQNRFEHTINNINVAVENLSASESAIRDTDMASEMVNFTRTQILSQAGTAMLAQANQIPQGVLRLLQ